MKPKLLVLELWGLGDLVIASPFLREASQRFEVTLLSQAHAEELRPHFWPQVRVVPFRAPWTAHRGKYRLHAWPWKVIVRLIRLLRRQRFDVAVSARWDPRDDCLIWLSGARRRVGFPRMGSRALETDPMGRPEPIGHRHERWRVIGQALGLSIPPLAEAVTVGARPEGTVLIHTGAGKLIRVWPLVRVQKLIRRIREKGYRVQVACDPEQLNWWRDEGEKDVAVPTSVNELLALVDRAAVFIGNDSGPGHVAGYRGVPTFTIFGPQLPEWFLPLHPQAEWMEGKPCPFKPCFDYCRFPEPLCLMGISEEELWGRIEPFLDQHLDKKQGVLPKGAA